MPQCLLHSPWWRRYSREKEVIVMQNRSMLVLEEGTCPFMGGPDYTCCFGALVAVR
jgi:hypothetical protein